MTKTGPGEFIRQVREEGRKIVWPTRQETVTISIFVAVLTIALALFFVGVDWLFSTIVRWALSLL